MPGGNWKRRQTENLPVAAATKENPFFVLLAGSVLTLAVLLLAAYFRRPAGATVPPRWRGGSPGVGEV